MDLRLVTYNVRSFRAGVERVAAVLEDNRADIALIQECGSRRALRRFGHAVGMEIVSTHRPFNRVRNAVMYRPPWRLLDVEVKDLSTERGHRRRGFVSVRLAHARARLTALSFHFGLFARERQRHARELTDHLGGIAGPVVLGGDLNERPEAPAARWIAERFYDVFANVGEGEGYTFPAIAPTARIDYLLVRDGIHAKNAWVPEGTRVERASDHRPVVADTALASP